MKILPAVLIMLSLLATPARADIRDSVLLQLREQGYSQIIVGRTWLGRLLITAERGGIHREIVINGRTGEILGDYARTIGLADSGSSDGSSDSGDATVAATEPDTTNPDNGASSVENEDAIILDPGNMNAVIVGTGD